ncbi:MAG: hypothetical protein CBB70_07295 [Planctomycetaceae bacterium TMED10]|nr:MAG: hypothetical protein CBB70_07295 [Planctomycetaceae bacterium TMED10]|tara:strand:- start:459 stop:830 length:372 start_codon:yes stop_codon:yes gene_type:complete
MSIQCRFFLLARTVKVRKSKLIVDRLERSVANKADKECQMVDFQYADDLGDNEYPDEADSADELGDDSTQTIICPACEGEIYEDAPQCPVCGHYITAHDQSRKSWWWLAVVILLLISLLLWMF